MAPPIEIHIHRSLDRIVSMSGTASPATDAAVAAESFPGARPSAAFRSNLETPPRGNLEVPRAERVAASPQNANNAFRGPGLSHRIPHHPHPEIGIQAFP